MSMPSITDEQYQKMFQIGVTPEMLGVKETSVKKMTFKNDVRDLWFTIHMCEHYLNAKIRTNRQYYVRLRHKALTDLLEVQLEEFEK